MDGTHIVEKLHQGKDYFVDADGHSYKITEDDIFVSIKDKEDFVFEANKDLYVALDTTLTPELIEEGLARELVNKIQFTRKEKGLDIMDRIKIFFVGNDEIFSVFDKFKDYVYAETLAVNHFRVKEAHDDMIKWDINEREVFLTVEKV